MFEDDNMDIVKIMQRYTRNNPHVSLSDIAFFMDVPYEPEFDFEDDDIFDE